MHGGLENQADMGDLEFSCWGNVPHLDIEGLPMVQLEWMLTSLPQLETLRARVLGTTPLEAVDPGTQDLDRS
ncbi:hypothetical protein CVT26_001923 [Gymnopilus dilepis]|uniref:Uncharacterized protein n=1 Tax=Gymnopilus dilepis TaxID=231916 RepID=A0A409Y417_9AGAR|nr:hypothetical protein CVT26_001923 [Gymnopilus dilepis]